VQADDGGRFAFVEVAENGLADVGAKLLLSVGLGDNGMAKGAGGKAAVRVVLGDLKHDFAHGFSIAEGMVTGKRLSVLDFQHLHFKWRGNLHHLTKPFSLRKFSLCFAHGI
jgi:hypothetical protein